MEFLNNCYDVKTGRLCLSHYIDEPGFINTTYKSAFSTDTCEVKYDTFPRIYDIWYYEGDYPKDDIMKAYTDGEELFRTYFAYVKSMLNLPLTS